MMTRPWSALKTYRRVAAKGPIWWREDICAENNVHVVICKEYYFLERGRSPDACQEGPIAARLAVF